mgnify:CR=1 FL=1
MKVATVLQCMVIVSLMIIFNCYGDDDTGFVPMFNGEQVIDLDLSTSVLKDRPAKGHISFQDEAKRICYRNVRIKELE